MMTEMMSKMTTRPQVTPMMVRLVLSRVSRILAFLFSSLEDKTDRPILVMTGGEVFFFVCLFCTVSTFAVVLIPGVNTVLDAVADQGLVNAHVAVAKESVSFARS